MFCNDANEIWFRYKAIMKGYIMFTQNMKFLLVVALMSLTVASVDAKDKDKVKDLSGYYGLNTGNGSEGITGVECTIGEMTLFAGIRGNGIPANGQLLDISSNQVLYSLLGTTYGGDGSTTFQLPDMRAITPNEMTWYICVAGVYPS